MVMESVFLCNTGPKVLLERTCDTLVILIMSSACMHRFLWIHCVGKADCTSTIKILLYRMQIHSIAFAENKKKKYLKRCLKGGLFLKPSQSTVVVYLISLLCTNYSHSQTCIVCNDGRSHRNLLLTEDFTSKDQISLPITHKHSHTHNKESCSDWYCSKWYLSSGAVWHSSYV